MEELYDLWLARVPISNKTKLTLLEHFTAKQIWEMNEKTLQAVCPSISKQNADDILQDIYKRQLEKYAKYMKEHAIRLLNFKEKLYPKKLHTIEDKPAYIFVRGNIHILDDESVAIIGTRKASTYGKMIAKTFGKQIADKGVHVVSGLAVGIDAYAHLGCLESSVGKTIAVLGTGLADMDVYPKQNQKIFERILENNGAIVSEYIMGTKPLKYHFPARNRIVSGLANKIIVVEAKEKSGTFITVDFALQQGKDIYAVPGNITLENAKGTNQLIKEGAFLLENIADLF